MTIGDRYELAMSITDQAEADKYFAWLMMTSPLEPGMTDHEVETLEKANLGYYAGYFDEETRARVYRLFGTTHPILGDKTPNVGEAMRARMRRARSGFTLIELLAVITIIVIVSAVALPTVIPALSHRQVGEAARILQSALVGARDAAIRDNAPSGIRLTLDPSFPIVRLADGSIDPSQPLASSAIMPLTSPSDYTSGQATAFGTDQSGATKALAVAESEGTWTLNAGVWVYVPNQPTSWQWNARVGDKMQLNSSGRWFTVCGPVVTANDELFVNGNVLAQQTLTAPDGVTTVTVTPEYLLLVNGLDDNANGWIDEGFDGVDNNGNGTVDEFAEWETEAWGSIDATLNNVPYALRRRPSPAAGTKPIALPSNVVVDLTTWATTQERSRLQVDRFTGFVDVMVYPNGSVVPTTIYSTPSSIGMAGAFAHFWLAERSDVQAPTGTVAPTLPTPAGNSWLVTLFARSGKVSSIENPSALVNPFTQAQQGVSQ